MTDEELKALVASNAQGIADLKETLKDRDTQWKESQAEQNEQWRNAMRESYEDMVTMLRQFAEEAAEDRQAIRSEMQGIRTELSRLTEHVLSGG